MSVENGNIVCTDAKGHRSSVTSLGKFDGPILAPDGYTVAFTRVLSEDSPDTGPGDTELWIGDCRTYRSHRLLAVRNPGDEKTQVLLPRADNFSSDGRYLFFSAYLAATEWGIHRYDLRSGTHTFIAGGEGVRIIRNGPYAGNILTRQHTCKPEGGCNYPLYILDMKGRKLLSVPASADWDDKAEAAWLKKKGWTAW
ncbi:MAG: hypothetical protein JF615_04030 [Asticcacaulis sp.]|nr:hypothetical protein [Asticcacaulis sp.]